MEDLPAKIGQWFSSPWPGYATALVLLIAILVLFVKQLRERPNLQWFLELAIPTLAGALLLIHHAHRVASEPANASSVLTVLGEISVVILVWFLFYRVHSFEPKLEQMSREATEAAKLNREISQTLRQFSDEVGALVKQISDRLVTFSDQAGALIAATDILDAKQIEELSDRRELKDWTTRLRDLRRGLVDNYLGAVRGNDPAAPLVKQTLFRYFQREIDNLSGGLSFASDLQIYASLVTDIGEALAAEARIRGKQPIMCFGNVLSLVGFFNYREAGDDETLGRTLAVLDVYRDALSRLRHEHNVVQCRFTFVGDGSEAVRLLNQQQYGKERGYVVLGRRTGDRFVPALWRPKDLSLEARAALPRVSDLESQTYLIVDQGLVDLPRFRNQLPHLGPHFEPFYNYFTEAMHDKADQCVMVDCSTDPPGLAGLGSGELFPRIPAGPIGSGAAVSRPIGDFVAFGFGEGDDMQKMEVLAVLVGDVEFDRDTLRLRLIHQGDSQIEAMQRLMTGLLSQRRKFDLVWKAQT